MRRARWDDARLRFFVGDVRDRARLTRAANGADILVHAAAMKQVPACEYNPFEAVSTNVLGTQHVVDAAIDAQGDFTGFGLLQAAQAPEGSDNLVDEQFFGKIWIEGLSSEWFV